MPDITDIQSFRTQPKNDAQMQAAFEELVAAMKAEEFPSGGVKAFGVFRDVSFGKWWTVAHYTGEAHEKHASGPKVKAALNKVSALLLDPAEVLKLDPVILWGVGAAPPAYPGRAGPVDLATDVGVVYQFNVLPEDDQAVEEVMFEIFEIVKDAEVSTGNVMTYNLYRDPTKVGNWAMFEYFTAKGSADHATDPRIFEPGFRQVALQTEPASRVLIKPLYIFGFGEPMPA